jgi:hypothetical protein
MPSLNMSKLLAHCVLQKYLLIGINLLNPIKKTFEASLSLQNPLRGIGINGLQHGKK